MRGLGRTALAAAAVLAMLPATAGAEFHFVPQPPIEVGPGMDIGPTDDYNGDGFADVIGSNCCNGDPGFTGRWGLYGRFANGLFVRRDPGPLFGLFDASAADLDGDDFPDLFDATAVDDLLIALNDGTGHFAGWQAIDLGQSSQVEWTEAADLDGDLDLDLAGVRNDGVVVALNDGFGGFSARPLIPLAGQPRGVRALQVNGDGKPDLVVSRTNDSRLVVLLADAAGGYTAIKPIQLTARNQRTPSVGDFNEDGRDDLALFNSCDGAGCDSGFDILLNTGTGTFAVHTRVPTGGVVADFDGDGHLDLGSERVIERGDGTGAFERHDLSYPVGHTSGVAADFNRDGLMDFLASDPALGPRFALYRVFVLLNDSRPTDFSLTPVSRTSAVGSTVTFTVALNRPRGQRIILSVTGTHPTNRFLATTANGTAKYKYTGTSPGSDTLTACYDFNRDNVCTTGEPTATATQTWQ